ncbi:hypothetical protein ACFY0N_00655 [Streptomyces vinaceus]|uniref:hypothetical protein n=1 Tax=Streptomyces vinaceus TaxID=1960 RepID=UPI0036A49F0B
MKVPPFLAGIWADPDADDQAAPAATPAAPAIPPKPAYAPDPPFVPTYNGRPIPAGSSVPPPGQTITLGPSVPAQAPAAAPCQHPRVRPEVDRATGELVSLLCDVCGEDLPVPKVAPQPPLQPDWWSVKRAASAPGPVENDDVEKSDAADDTEGSGDGGSDANTGRGGRLRAHLPGWLFDGQGHPAMPRPVNASPVNVAPVLRSPRQSAAEWLATISPQTKFLCYHGVAFGIGWYLGIVQFVTAETAYIVHLCAGDWTDSMALTGYVPAAIILLIDRYFRRARSWFAFPVRVITVSLITGVLLYGSANAL